jgi:hypothetical protein
MSAVRKITIHLPVDLIEDAQAASGAGVTETVRQGLEALKRERFYAMMKDLRGKIDFSGFDLEALREDKTCDWESRER